MSLEENVDILINLKEQLDNINDQYQRQRSIVYTDLTNRGQNSCEIRNYCISKVENSTFMQLKVEEVIKKLIELGYTEEFVREFIFESKVEKNRNGILKITKLR